MSFKVKNAGIHCTLNGCSASGFHFSLFGSVKLPSAFVGQADSCRFGKEHHFHLFSFYAR